MIGYQIYPIYPRGARDWSNQWLQTCEGVWKSYMNGNYRFPRIEVMALNLWECKKILTNLLGSLLGTNKLVILVQ